MAATGTGIAIVSESRAALRARDRRRGYICFAKPVPSRAFFISLMMCFPVSCMLWAAIVYGAVRLVR